MIRSMTGFGEASRALEASIVRVTMRSVNHRYLNLSFKAPSGLDKVEQEMSNWLRPHLTRGHIQITIAFEGALSAKNVTLPELDVERARHYAHQLTRLHEELGIPGGPDVAAVSRFGDIFRVPDPAARVLPDDTVLKPVIEEAAQALVASREVEGQRLQADLEARLQAMESQVDVIAARAPERLVRERERLRAAISELAGQTDVDDDRLAREVAYLAERWDVNEEIVRFRSHAQLFRETLAGSVAEGVGKRLSFIVQEMHREVNTMSSKANDAEISRATVAMKEDIERLREQVENVE
jgi:uncharacterized protein (TIGR00255 family)